MDYDQQEYETWLDEVSYELFALLGESLDDYDVNYLDLFLRNLDPESAVREIYES